MSDIVGVVNYGIAGNIFSIKKAIEKAGAKVEVVQSSDQLDKVDKIVLPGVGSFADGMRELAKASMIDSLKDNICKKPALGICLGMQLMSKIGFEYGETEGLGLFDSEVKPVQCHGKIPHMGFNSIHIVNENKLLKNIDEEQFYFMHSYEVVNYTNVISLTEYSGHKFVSAIQRDEIYGVQFHPEKSRDAGIEVFKNFIEI